MLKIGENWGIIANYPLYAQKRLAPLLVTSYTPGLLCNLLATIQGQIQCSLQHLDVHEGRQDVAVLISVVTQRGVLVVRIAYGCPYYKDPAIFTCF